MFYNPLLEKEDENAERTSFEDELRRPLCANCERLGRFRRRLSRLSAILIPLTLFATFILIAITLRQTLLVRDSVMEPVTHRVYGNDRNYMSLDHKFDYLWEPDAVGDSGAVELPPGQFGGIGMFHQLHCLTGFRKVLQKAREGEKIGMDDTDDPHWPHCFHYLRQAIHCAADETIERPRFRNGSLGAEWINGQWDVRRCGDADKLYALRDAHRP